MNEIPKCDLCGLPILSETGFTHVCCPKTESYDDMAKRIRGKYLWWSFVRGFIIGWLITDFL